MTLQSDRSSQVAVNLGELLTRVENDQCLAIVTLAAVLGGCGSYNSGSTYTGTPKETATFTVLGTSTTGTPATTISTQVTVTVQ